MEKEKSIEKIEEYVKMYKPEKKFGEKIEKMYQKIITVDEKNPNYNKQLTQWILLLKGLFELPCYENFNNENDLDRIEITTNDFEILNNKIYVRSETYFSHAWLYYEILKQNNFKNDDKATECLNSIHKSFRLNVLLYVNEQNPKYKIPFECIKSLNNKLICTHFLNKCKNLSPLSIEQINELFNSNEDESLTKKENFSLYIIEAIRKNLNSEAQWHLLLKQWFNLPCYENFTGENGLDKIKITVADFEKLNELYGGVMYYQTSWPTYFFKKLLEQNEFNSENPEVLNCFKLIPEQYRVEIISCIKKQDPNLIITSELKNLLPNVIEQLNFIKDISEIEELIIVHGKLNINILDIKEIESKFLRICHDKNKWHLLLKRLFDLPYYDNNNKITIEDFKKLNEIYNDAKSESGYFSWYGYYLFGMLNQKRFTIDKEFIECFGVIHEEIRSYVLLDILKQYPKFVITDEIISLLPESDKSKVSVLKEKINTAKNEINNLPNKTRNISGVSVGSIAFVVGVPLLVIGIITFNPYLIATGVVCILGGSIADGVTIPKLIKRKSDLEKLESEGLENPEDKKWRNPVELRNFFYEKYLSPKLDSEQEKNTIEM